ncbi:hypothetical protein BGZ61DRAFT_540345 [Ilyonectria robusta]|uniref:uncharacterized protein n=1 Tax=Ilyonectria robusta TaxID=1079257 RepID=UPI001E8D7A88|nr:uncharacterized protein BGZ61DRAFT_540345 [Ilyonectria robusta]KAH8659004.1 hypothetical protein BGZ61DRAFT_540345 [Ilyonectria robusta]
MPIGRDKLRSGLDKFKVKVLKRPKTPVSGSEATSAQEALPPSAASDPPPASEPELSALQTRLWNKAYEGVKQKEPTVAEAYEKILFVEIPKAQHDSTGATSEQNATSAEMIQLVNTGVERTKKEVEIKGTVKQWLDIVNSVKGVIDNAIKVAPDAAVAWAGICIGLEIITNPTKEPELNRTGITHVLLRMRWYWKLADLLLGDERAQASRGSLRGELEEHLIQLYQSLLLYQMKSVCLYHRNWAAVLLRDAVKFDDWAAKLEAIKSEETAIKADIEQHNSEIVKSTLSDIERAAQHQSNTLEDILSSIQVQNEQQKKRHESDADKLCRKDLLLTDPRMDKKRIEDSKGGLLEGSYKWILDHSDYKTFLEDPQSRLFWIRGEPGKGKTMLVCGIIDHLNHEKKPVSYVFCQETSLDLRTSVGVIRGLIYDLISRDLSLISHVRRKYDIEGKKLFEGVNAWWSLKAILSDMLRDWRGSSPILVVDALDECTTERGNLMKLIVEFSNSPDHNAKWVVSSRDWPEIAGQLKGANKTSMRLELNQDNISNAVKFFIEKKVNDLAIDKEYEPETRDSVSTELVSKANDTFLWVALACQTLGSEQVTKWNTLEILKSIPTGLPQLYKRMMTYILGSPDKDIYKQILATVCVILRPITISELKALVEQLQNRPVEGVRNAVESCGSFLTLREDVVYFIHQSAKDFLLKEGFDQIFPSGIAHQHRKIFFRSMDALEGLKQDMFGLKSPGYLIGDVQTPDPNPLSPMTYSCVFWAEHLLTPEVAAPGEDNEALKVVEKFFRNKFLHWLEALSLLRKLPTGIVTMLRLESDLGEIGTASLAESLRDARRFVQSCHAIIEAAPLQVYASALVFSPTRSLVRERFAKSNKVGEEGGWLLSGLPLKPDWDACLHTLDLKFNTVSVMALSPDGTQIAACLGNAVHIWDSTSFDCIATFQGFSSEVLSLNFSQDGQRLATGEMDGGSRIWATGAGSCISTFRSTTKRPIFQISFASDDRQLVTCSNTTGRRLQLGQVEVWDVVAGEHTQPAIAHYQLEEGLGRYALSPSGMMLVAASHRSTINLYYTLTMELVKTLGREGHPISSMAFTTDGNQLATAPSHGTLQGHTRDVSSLAFSPTKKQLVSAAPDALVKIWDTSAKDVKDELDNETIQGIALSPNGRLVASTSKKCIKVWDAIEASCIHTLEHQRDWPYVDFSPDGQNLCSLSKSQDGRRGVDIWCLNQGVRVLSVEEVLSRYSPTWFVAKDHRVIALALLDGSIGIWNLADGVQIRQLPNGYIPSDDSRLNPRRLVALSSNGRWFASGCGTDIKIWNVDTGRLVHLLSGHRNEVECITWSPLSDYLASTDLDGDVKIWDMTQGSCTHTVSSSGYCSDPSLTFSPDQKLLVIGFLRYERGFEGKTVNIWDMDRRVVVRTTLTCHLLKRKAEK